MSNKRLGTAAAISAVALSMLVLIALAARVSSSSKLRFQDDSNVIALRSKDALYGTHEDEGLELHTSSSKDIDTQLRARKSKSKKDKANHKRSGKRGNQVSKTAKKVKRVYKITYPKYAVIQPNEVTYTSSATGRKGQIVVEDWRQH